MKLKTIDIKGKEYVLVNERIKAFWELHPCGRIITELKEWIDGFCIIRAEVYLNKEDERPAATGLAYERESSSFINKTSYIENCETSAVGRALGILGIGIDTSVASAEELEIAIENQKKIDSTKIQALERAISNRNISSDKVTEVLEKFNYKSISDILVIDYKRVCDELQKGAN